MINRPPLISEVLDIEGLSLIKWNLENGDKKVFCATKNENACMQEALTVEWLIEQGFMPDPSEVFEPGKKVYSVTDDSWVCEDKTQ